MGIIVIGIASPQYTSRGRKTLMISWRCSYCGVVKAFRKARIDSWKTNSCGCAKLRVIKMWSVYHDLTVLVEAPKTRDKYKSRQLLVRCKCSKKILINISEWWHKKSCGHCCII